MLKELLRFSSCCSHLFLWKLSGPLVEYDVSLLPSSSMVMWILILYQWEVRLRPTQHRVHSYHII